mgnify:CR=1 FL=1
MIRVLFIGLGSIAKKHIAALKELKPESEIFALRSSSKSNEMEGVKSILALSEVKEKFTFAGSGVNITPQYVYAISVARQQLREKMDPGNWELHISGSGNKKYKFVIPLCTQ